MHFYHGYSDQLAPSESRQGRLGSKSQLSLFDRRGLLIRVSYRASGSVFVEKCAVGPFGLPCNLILTITVQSVSNEPHGWCWCEGEIRCRMEVIPFRNLNA